jgi:hypothetical protein
MTQTSTCVPLSNLEQKLKDTSIVLLMLAERFCGPWYDLRANGEPSLSVLLGLLQRYNLVERFEHKESYTAAMSVDYVGIRFTKEARTLLKEVRL